MEIIGEPISVLAAFKQSGCAGSLKPVKFIWGTRSFDVSEVTYRWKGMEGNTVIYYFSVTAGQTLYELSFNTVTMLWRLEALEAG